MPPHFIMRCFALAFLLCASATMARVLHVPAEYTELQLALDACQEADTVLVARGTYYGQFLLPECSVHLYSHHVLTGDTLDVEETILDGEYGGTVVTGVYGEVEYDLQGFTVRHGQGHYYGNVVHSAGGLQFDYCTTFRIDHCVIRDCQTDGYSGAAINQEQEALPLPRRCQITHSTLVDIQQLRSANDEFGAVYAFADSVYVRNLKAYTVTTEGFCVLNSGAFGYLECSGITIRNMHIDQGMFLNGWSEMGCHFQDISMTNCSISAPWNDGFGGMARFCDLHSDTLLMTIRNLTLDNCRRTGHQGAQAPGSGAACSITAMHLDADSILFRNCHTDFGGLMEIGDMYAIEERWVDRIRNLRVEGCTYGQEEFVGDPENDETIGNLISTGGVDLVDCLFLDNVGIGNALPVGPTGPSNYVYSLLWAFTGSLDTLRLTRLQFVNNLVIDRDTYSPGRGWLPNLGRAMNIHAGNSGNPLIIMDSCQFVEQRQPNWIPERDDDTMINECGNVLYVRGEASLLMRNCLFQGIDDGGLYAFVEGDATIQNCQFLDVDRATCLFAAKCLDSGAGGAVRIENLYLRGGQQYDCYHPTRWHSWQVTLRVASGIGATVRNCTFANNNPVTMFGYQDLVSEVIGAEVVTNCLFTGNQYDYWIPHWSDQDVMFFNNCLLQEAIPGENNLIGLDPRFDPVLGAPFLAPNSPCIDAGDPGDHYNDVADPSAPDFALWPSQGSLRNDIGYTGGPYAAVQEFVGLSPQVDPVLPTSPTLGEAYPNPFNPVTTIPFTLPQAGHFTLQVYNLRGQLVQTLANTDFAAGEHRVRFDGRALASGVYLVRLAGPRCSSVKKVLLVK